MAATAYAAAVSLLNTMDNIKIHPSLSLDFRSKTMESLREKVDFLVDIVEKYSDAESEEAKDLLRRIADVAHEAEEIINVEASDRIRIASAVKLRIMRGRLKKITREMDCIKEKAKEENCSHATVALKGMLHKLQRKKGVMDSDKEEVIKAAEEKTGFLNRQLTSSVPFSSLSSSSAALPANVKTATMVGFDGYLEQLLDELTGHHSGRKILPIVGMGGIGKTTLATNVYQNSLILYHFDIRAWITVSQEFSARNIILQALSCLGGGYNTNTNTSKSDDELGEKLYKVLSGLRYLIVLDDIWSVEAWEKIKFFFPENNNRSRIVVTTRESELVDYFGSSALVVDFLDDKNSWELFCDKTFAQQDCPHPELEKIGKKIVKKCKGLPLAIIVIGGLLGKSSKTQEYWETIAKYISLILDSGEGNIKPLSILYLSYKHLPVWLKSCFLYLGLFPEDYEIEVSQLIKLWVAEGFIRSKTEQSLEEIAESYTKELVDRNLLLVGRLGLDNKLESCRVHDVVRELCIWIGEKEKYFFVQREIDEMHHFIVDEPTARLFYPRELKARPSLIRPLILEEQSATLPFKSRLLRVLLRGMSREDAYSQYVNLRFLFNENTYAASLVHWLHSSIHLLWSLQTLIVHHSNKSFDAPSEIWKMPQLRYIEILESISLPNPLIPTREYYFIVLENLQTLKRVENLILSEEVCKRIPNIKELGISYKLFNDQSREASSCYHLQNLGRLNKLESLHLYARSYEWEYGGGDSLPKLELPSSLKELSISGWKLVRSDMAMIASLPHLQFLKLEEIALAIPEWDCVEGDFLSLKHLQIHGCDDLINWSTTDGSGFPVLETLSLEGLYKLEEIPSGIGDIPTLERIHISKCSELVAISAMKILEEQESLGNQSLQLTLKFWNVITAERWRMKIQQLGITSKNLHIQIPWRRI